MPLSGGVNATLEIRSSIRRHGDGLQAGGIRDARNDGEWRIQGPSERARDEERRDVLRRQARLVDET